MKHIKRALFCFAFTGMLCGTTVVSASTAGMSSYVSFLMETEKSVTAGVSNVLTESMVLSARTEKLAGATAIVANQERRIVASPVEEELEENSISGTSLGAAVTNEYTYMAVCKTDSYVNVRASANTESHVVGKLRNNNVATVDAVEGDWYKIRSGQITGYVRSDLVIVGDEDLLKSLGTYTYGESKAEEEARLKAEAEKKRQEAAQSAAKYEQYVNNYYGAAAAGTSGQAIVDYALQFVGCPYVYGGNSLTNGTDCSGFTKLVFAQFGYNLPRTSSSYRYVGKAVSLSEARPGDIIVYTGHVAIYMGNGQIVHAANSRKGIITSGINFGTLISVRRIVE